LKVQNIDGRFNMERTVMLKLALAGAAAAALLCSGVSSTPAAADGFIVHRHYHHYHHYFRHPHIWGNGLWDVIRWSYGDCKIWHDDLGPPFGDGWTLIEYDIPNPEIALDVLHHRCGP
jgi:hypothetical protein